MLSIPVKANWKRYSRKGAFSFEFIFKELNMVEAIFLQ